LENLECELASMRLNQAEVSIISIRIGIGALAYLGKNPCG